MPIVSNNQISYFALSSNLCTDEEESLCLLWLVHLKFKKDQSSFPYGFGKLLAKEIQFGD